MAAAIQTFNLARFVNDRPISRFQYLVVTLCALTVFLDGFDTQSVAFVAPHLQEAWHIERSTLGPVFSSSLVGLLIGALFFGPLADKIGRRRVLMLCTAIFAIFTLATAASTNVTELMIFRLIAGLGLGGGMPNAIALTAEYCPLRRRGTCVMIMFMGFSLGAAAAGGLAALVIPHWGWRSVWLIGGIVPLLLLPIQFVWLPESIRFLVLAKAARERIASILRRMDPGLSLAPETRFDLGEEIAAGVPVPQLFAGGRALGTSLIWVMYFANLLALFFLQNWIPTITHAAGVDASTADLIGTLFQIGGVLASLVLGIAVDSFGGYVVLAIMYLCGAAFVILIGRATGATPLMLLTLMAGFCVVGAQNSSNAATALFYPTSIRSTGVGWALGIGRIGAIIGPLVGGYLVALKWPNSSIFLLGSIPLFCAMLAAIVVAIAYRGGRSVAAEDAPGSVAERARQASA